MKKITIALTAHVDAGKTTLAEALLHVCGALRQPGRVDLGSAALDSTAQERARGITVFAGEACLRWQDAEIDLLDTPGHVDFSPETERVLAAADAAVLVISGLDGVQPHTLSLWRLLEKRALPTLLFISKMDTGRRSRAELLNEVQTRLSGACLPAEELLSPGEEAALLKESLLERYLAGEPLTAADGLALVRAREAFPVFFGSGLKEEGVEALLRFLASLAPDWSVREPEPFGARVFKISYDEKGTRLTHVKCLAGSIRPREELSYPDGRPAEKIAQIRRYTGARFTQEESLSAGSCGVLTGLAASRAGDAFGLAAGEAPHFFEPVMRYTLLLPEGLAPEQAMPSLKRLAEEDPSLHLHYEPALGSIFLDLMGPVQGEIVTALIRERCGWETALSQGRILYQETLTAPVEGVGHYEPLRHYAEVHLALLPLPRGSGIRFADLDGGETLAGDMRRLILGQLAQKRHRGVLCGGPLTDVQIVLLGGRFHEKHTEGGDFREAAWRAVRQGLMEARRQNALALLEPYLGFSLWVPAEKQGRAFTDIQARCGSIGQEESEGASADGLICLTGRVPLAALQDYAAELASYTGGRGRLKTWPDGYDLCHNTEEVLAAAAYDPAADRENPPDSVFCRNGGGFSVPWDQVPAYMHLPYILPRRKSPLSAAAQGGSAALPQTERRGQPEASRALDAELEAIMQREFGPIKRPALRPGAERFYEAAPWREPVELKSPEDYIVDGYNLIFAWDELKKLAEKGLDYARTQLEHRLQNFAAFTGRRVMLVFDGYRVPGGTGSEEARAPLEIVYTAENETADMYIERYLTERKKKESAVVVSNDNLIRLCVIRQGGLRMSCELFLEEYAEAMRRLKELTAEGKAFGAPAELPAGAEETGGAP